MANTYVDDIKVKISEKYKPPFRISMPMSYSQRLTINKQIQDSQPIYDFHLERTVLDKMKEWKDIRNNLSEERKDRLVQARIQFDEKIQKDKLEKEQAQMLEESSKNIVLEPVPKQIENPSENIITSNGILMPTRVISHLANANILKPISLQNTNFQTQVQTTAKPFNLSDFESDTSSPFDNMELKSINDLEELALVLKSDHNSLQSKLYQNTNVIINPGSFNQAARPYNTPPCTTKSFNSLSQASANNSGGYRGNVSGVLAGSTIQDTRSYSQMTNCYSQVNTTISQLPPSFSHYNNIYNPQNTTYSNFNDYVYKNPIQTLNQIQLGPTTSYAPSSSIISQPNLQKTSCKSVPDLVNSLENSQITDSSTNAVETRSKKSQSYKSNNVELPARPKSTDAVYPKTKTRVDIFDPFERLSAEEKELCTGVSMMGFPLDRVARVCLIIGNDQKKIVDHLLALSDLLDLGFSEKMASEALIKKDNDRDKALDLLIS